MLPPWSRSALTARSRSCASACSSAPPEVILLCVWPCSVSACFACMNFAVRRRS
jgi:hypothetical protein